LHVGTVDCTTDYGKPLCNHYEVKGYPTLLYFPGASGDAATRYVKFSGPRSKEYLVDFALNGGWESAETEEIPKNLEGMDYWKRYVQRAMKDFTNEVDMMFVHYELDKTVPPIARYVIACSIVCAPILLLMIMLCCCVDDYSVEETKRVNPGVKKVQPGSPKKKAEKIE
jgi:hypothetical protein